MSMLAGPRQKKGYRLLPKGKPLYEDESSFGSRMLQKMGWSKGKGLGANESGDQDFIRVKYKNDANGLGFKDRNDGWTQHKTEFETLLKSLNNSLENSDEEQELSAGVGFGFRSGSSKKEYSVEHKLSGESLEEKSKKSRARVHYKKFTRGKDLSQYSEKDLANIFGKKTLDISKEEPRKLEEVLEEKAGEKESVFGVQMINTGTSINDYFKNKMALLKSGRRQNNACDENQKSSEDNSLGNEESVTENLISKKKKEKIEEVETASNDARDYPETDEVQKIKKKKRQNLEITIPMNIARDQDGCVEVASKKKKKRKNFDENSTSLEDVRDSELIKESVEKKLKKQNKDLNDTEVESTNTSEYIEGNGVGEEIFKKKSKKERSNLDEVPSHQVAVEISKAMAPSKHNETCEVAEKKSKKKKRKLQDDTIKADSCENYELNKVDITEKKSNKKKKTFDDAPSPEAEPEPLASRSKQSKKENLRHFNTENTQNTSNVEKTEKELPSDIKQASTSENISETIANNSKEADKPRKNKKSKEERKKSEVSQGVSETENLNATSTVSENEISSTPTCTYKINSFVAEIFRHTDIGGFVGSNLSEIVGYTLSEDVVLKVTPSSSDEMRIYEMWQNAISKYQEFQKQQQLQSEKEQEEIKETEPVKKTYKNKRRRNIRNRGKNIFRIV